MFYYRTAGFQGYAVKYSPFFDNRLACAASANYGLVGNGRVFVLSLTPQGIVADKWFLPLPLFRLLCLCVNSLSYQFLSPFYAALEL